MLFIGFQVDSVSTTWTDSKMVWRFIGDFIFSVFVEYFFLDDTALNDVIVVITTEFIVQRNVRELFQIHFLDKFLELHFNLYLEKY